jgi:hypothetical protein
MVFKLRHTLPGFRVTETTPWLGLRNNRGDMGQPEAGQRRGAQLEHIKNTSSARNAVAGNIRRSRGPAEKR